MYLSERHRRIGRWSALLAVYAFVLNALLATTLLAATSASKSLSGFELCAGAGSASAVDHDERNLKRAAIHCQLCLHHAAAPALPPTALALPPTPAVFSPAVLPAHTDRPFAQKPPSNHPARGPPSLS